jgi:hypothetical protein
MGYNATVVVLLDQLDAIERDPEFGKKLAAAIRYRGMVGPGDDRVHPGHRFAGAEATGQTYVVEVHHADDMIAVAVGGNYGHVLDRCGDWRMAQDTEAMIKTLERRRKIRAKTNAV